MSEPEPPELTDEELAFLSSVFDLVRDGETATVLGYVDQGLPANLTNANGDTLLILAAYHQHADLVDGLLAHGADTARVNDRGQTALAAAVFRQHSGIVTALLDAGADPLLGSPTAPAVAEFFHLPDMAALLNRS